MVLETTEGQLTLQVKSPQTEDQALAPPNMQVFSKGFATNQNVPGTIFVRGQNGFAGLLANESSIETTGGCSKQLKTGRI